MPILQSVGNGLARDVRNGGTDSGMYSFSLSSLASCFAPVVNHSTCCAVQPACSVNGHIACESKRASKFVRFLAPIRRCFSSVRHLVSAWEQKLSAVVEMPHMTSPLTRRYVQSTVHHCETTMLRVVDYFIQRALLSSTPSIVGMSEDHKGAGRIPLNMLIS
jgi:hypothetical protein